LPRQHRAELPSCNSRAVRLREAERGPIIGQIPDPSTGATPTSPWPPTQPKPRLQKTQAPAPAPSTSMNEQQPAERNQSGPDIFAPAPSIKPKPRERPGASGGDPDRPSAPTHRRQCHRRGSAAVWDTNALRAQQHMPGRQKQRQRPEPAFAPPRCAPTIRYSSAPVSKTHNRNRQA